MSETPNDPPVIDEAACRAVIDAFINSRPKYKKSGISSELRAAWLADAAKQGKQMQSATHPIKAFHSSISSGSSILLDKPFVDEPNLIGTHTFGTTAKVDIALLDAKAAGAGGLLDKEVHGISILKLIVDRHPAMLAALSSDVEVATHLANQLGAVASRSLPQTSNNLAKQVFFPVDDSYHLLSPLFPSGLAQEVHTRLAADQRERIAATRRKDPKDKAPMPRPNNYRSQPGMLALKLGGAKPLNVSVLNSSRQGWNHLLPNLPPTCNSDLPRPPWGVSSIFDRFGPIAADNRLATLTRKVLRPFLAQQTDFTNSAIRAKRAELVATIVEGVLANAAQLQALPTGWSQHPKCRLSNAQKRWLDGGAFSDRDTDSDGSHVDWASAVAENFADWLNREISSDRTVMGSQEFQAWFREFREALQDEN